MKIKWKKFTAKAWQLLKYNPKEFAIRVKANIVLSALPGKNCELDIDGVRFQVEDDFAPMMKEICYGVYETEITSLLKKYIRKGDTCIDVGANIGYISAYMLSLVGETGEVHSFEPVPDYFSKLDRVRSENPQYKLLTNNNALGDSEGSAEISVTNLDNIGWNTMVPDFMSENTIKEKIEIPVKRLDEYLTRNQIGNVRLIKIDTEGFEYPVLKGLTNYLDTCIQLPILIVEVAPSAYPKLGFNLSELSNLVEKYGYTNFDITTNRTVDLTSLSSTTNVVFINPKFH